MRWIWATLLGAALGGCAHYVPKPVAPAEIVLKGRSLDPAAVAAELHRLAPAARFDPAHWDRLTLFAAVLSHNPDIAAARAALASAQAAARAARASPGPTLTLASEYAGAAADPSPWLFGAAVDVPLDTGGRRAVRLTAASFAVASARADLAEAVWAARMTAMRALSAVKIATRQRDVLLELAKVRRRHFDAVERRVRAGEAVRSELERVRADASDASRQLNDARTRLSVAAAQVAAAIGVVPNAMDGVSIDWADFEAPDKTCGPRAADWVTALADRPDVLKAMVAYDTSENDLRGEIAKQRPAFTLSPGYTWERGLVKLPFNIGLALPPLDLNRRAIAAAEQRRVEAGTRLEAVLATARGNYDAAGIEACGARDALASVRAVDRPAATRLAQDADRQLRAGEIDRTDWAAAQAGALLSQLAELNAVARVRTADLAVEDALRRPLEGPERVLARAGR